MSDVALMRRWLSVLALMGCCAASNKLVCAPRQLNQIERAAARELSLCALMTEPAFYGILANRLILAAEKDLAAKNPGAKYRLVRVVEGPEKDEVSILFVNLTYSDVYEVYVGSQGTGKLFRAHDKSGFEYPLGGCG